MTSRRQFVRSSLTIGGAVLAAGTSQTRGDDAKAPQSAPAATSTSPANDKPNIAVIGAGGMALFHGQFFGNRFNLVAVCDVDQNRADAYNEKYAAGNAFVTKNHQEIVTRDDIDVVMIASPDHWHTQQAADVLRAGKDLYCEKPMTLTIAEGRFLCDVARKTGRVIQVGTQQRSDERMQTAIALTQLGRLGKVRCVKVVIGDSPQAQNLETQPVPPELDWDRWLGQAPLVDYIPKRCHYDFRWWYEYSGGRVTDWGAHHVDIAQAAIAPDLPGPMRVEPVAVHHPIPLDSRGMPTRGDGFNTAATFTVKCSFANGTEMIITDQLEGFPDGNGILIEGEESSLFINRKQFTGPAVDALKENPIPEGMVPKLRLDIPQHHDRHQQNLVDCMKSRATPISDIYTHHKHLTTCHLANIALRLGRAIQWDATSQTIVGDEEANALQSRPQRKGYEIS